MFKIGLTGSIGSGKSTVSKIIREEGIFVIDTDEISRSLTRGKSPILDELTDAFGDGILSEDRTLDRRKLAEIAFSESGIKEGKKKLLESIVTEKVKKIMWEEAERLEEQGEKILVFDIPLLFESRLENSFDEVWSVVADEDLRYRRAHERDGISREDFDARNRAQVSEDEKRMFSDVVIENDGPLMKLKETTLAEIERVKKLSELYSEIYMEELID